MTQHHDECPKQIIACQYSFAGCEEKFTRELTQYHNHMFVQYHLDIAIYHLNNTGRQLKATETRLTATETQLEKARSRIESSGESSTVIKVPYIGNREYISPGFYAKGRYQFGLKVSGCMHNTQARSIAISVMSGRCDDELEWPVTAIVTIHQLNQNKDEDHRLVVDKEKAFFKSKVIPSAVSQYQQWRPLGFGSADRRDNCIFLKVRVDVNRQPAKPWLV